MSEPTGRILSALERRDCNPRRSGAGWSARCPAHDDQRASLSVSAGDNGGVVLHCHAGCSADSIVRAMGLSMADLMPQRRSKPNSRPAKPSGSGRVFPDAQSAQRALEAKLGPAVARWDYRDARGNLVGAVLRWNPSDGSKTIRPLAKHLDGWRIGAMPEPRPLYRLPEIVTAGAETPIVVCEGEKAADAARRCGLLATTSAGGAKAAEKTDWTPARGRRVVILPDNDPPGLAYALDVARLAHAAGAKDVRILRLADYAPELPDGGDLADALDSPTWCGLPLSEVVDPEGAGEWILATAESLEPWGPRPAGPALEWKPYPTDALPEPFRRFVESTAKAFGCDASYVALPLLVAAASAIGTTRRLEAKAGWRVPPILWAAIVGESGTLKTPALWAALQWTQRRQRKLLAEHDEARRQFESEWLAYEKALGEWRRSRSGGLPPAKPEAPAAERVLVQDTTVEALAPILKANPRGVLLARDELAGWLAGFDRYANTTGADAPFWLSVYNALSFAVDRKTSGTLHVPTAAVSIAGGIQPGVLSRALGLANRENGLAARLLLVMPPRRAKRWSEAGVEPAAADAVGAVFDGLFALEHDTGDNGEPVPRLMRLSPEAKAAYVRFYNEHAKELTDAEGDWAAALSKLEELPLRLGLALHLVRWAAGESVEPDTVDADSMARAVRLTGWHKHETRRVYDGLEGDAEDAEQRALVEWIQRRGGAVTVRDLLRGVWRFRGKGDEAETALHDLAKAGYGVWADAPVDNRGGRPKRVFRLIDAHRHRRNPENARDSEGFVDVDVVDEPQTPAPGPDTLNLMPPVGRELLT